MARTEIKHVSYFFSHYSVGPGKIPFFDMSSSNSLAQSSYGMFLIRYEDDVCFGSLNIGSKKVAKYKVSES